ncbi:iron-hydroxamate ABC transporter substrate-binding protein [Alkalihalobacillus pseudalcaliphilus]|uniref:iron-hydroxamate ABC transporter substrate-binding protein n=1 Tax=Alkalihalobacillus pseudalcaliphilus TaxID=79884 RepID=UPI00064E096D|nr:iron-hydroxamate ABC transporter substrate-binding protein [Alkalihalobacillus pseudalcaliphilus]KMK75603.1 ABC transporter substrate-binding protein [Alkalihalobacillus pseudalcaliphilus]
MKRLGLLILFACVFLTACGNENSTNGGIDGLETEDSTVTYDSETGPIEVPADPQRIIALTNGPNVLALDGKVVGIDQWTNMNPLFDDKLEDVEIVSEENLEQIIELDPDLIIAGSYMKNLDKMSDIAPTVVYTWGELDYLDQQVEIGKLLNKEEEATKWVADFQERAEASGKAIREKIGEDSTISVLETGNKEIYVFGDNYARGTEILYQAMNLNMPEKVEEQALESGVYTLSYELLPDFAGDFIVLSKNPDVDNSFMETETWNNIPAVKNEQIIEINSKASTYSDPITLEYLLEIFETALLGE